MIDQNIIEEIELRANVSEVIGDLIKLKRTGANLTGVCPFHDEKTGSFTVSPAKNMYKCFGCGKSGRAVTFVMEYKKFSFPEAIHYLADKYRIQIPEPTAKKVFTAPPARLEKMEKSTKVYWRKLIVMVKTVGYYVRLVLFPKRLGLFHVYGYHQEEPLDYADNKFWFGLASILVYVTALIFAPFPIKFGLIWCAVYYSIFSNFITANQFVSERYVHTPIFGLAIIAAYFFVDYPIILAFLIGIYVMRVWVHLPTFANEVRYYESNCFNFPDSEVAMGNLGVAYMNHGMHYKAYDTWHEGTRQNPLYDVPWYNLYSICKQNGDLISAKKFLAMCLNSKTVHFSEQWQKEMKELEAIIFYSELKKKGDLIKARSFLKKCVEDKIIPENPNTSNELTTLDAIIAKAVSDGHIKLEAVK